MRDAVASGRDPRPFALAHHTHRKLGGLPLPIGEREQTESASPQT
jgi:hypothetical protein